jgi:hypothetical protein
MYVAAEAMAPGRPRLTRRKLALCLRRTIVGDSEGVGAVGVGALISDD